MKSTSRDFWLTSGVLVLFLGLAITRHDMVFHISAQHSLNVPLIFTGALLLALLWRLLQSVRRVSWQLLESEELFRAVFENTAVGLVHIDRQGNLIHANEAFCHMLGYEPAEVMSPQFQFARIFYSDTVRAKLFGAAADETGRILPANRRALMIEPCRGKDDRLVWLDFYVERLNGNTPSSPAYIIAVVDVSTQRIAAAELAEYRENLEKLVAEQTADLKTSEERFRFIAEHNQDVIWMMNLRTEKFTYVSPSVFTQRGFTVEEVMAQSPWDALTPESREHAQIQLNDLLVDWRTTGSNQLVKVIEAEQPHRDGHFIFTEIIVSLHPDENGDPGTVLGVTRDITARKRAEEELKRLAFYDGLTQLPNRRLLFDRLRQAMRHARRKDRRIALLFIDLDKFKPINDELGHHIGDWLLREVSRRMEENLRAYDTAARMGGDEFIILLPDLQNLNDAFLIAERVRLSVERPFVTPDGSVLELSSSIGIALFPDHADNEHDLLRMGDEAMYRAKKSGRNRVEMLSIPALPFQVEPSSLESEFALRLAWNRNLECGVSQLDEEHQALFEQANEVITAALTQTAQPEQFMSALDALLEDIARHFHHEESILMHQSYPYLKEHAEKHQWLLGKASALRQAAVESELPLRDLVDFLAVEMVVQHILTDDRQYFECLNRN